ncbi:MAG: lytic murein transglycosylase [Desulforegulaceae bacterium]|nr:lytic murein transglycosylase [Desulforegulaceae bacterium]
MKFTYKFFLIFLAAFYLLPPGLMADHSYFDYIKQKLINDGFDKEYIEKIYSPESIKFEFGSTTLFFTVSEYKLDYDRFLGPDFVKKGKEYINKYEETFSMVKEKYKVPPEIITAILTVETKLGGFIGNRPVLSSLSSIASLENSKIQKMVQKSIPSQKNRYSGDDFVKRAENRADFGYKELKKFIDFAKEFDHDTSEIIGSYAGAVGIPQFMPSNIPVYARDGDMDGKIDLLNHKDAIASVGNYLKMHGWPENQDEKKLIPVILRYNKSMPYAQTVLKLSQLIGENN